VLETLGREREWEVVGVVLMTGEWVGYANFDHVSRIQGAPGMVSVLLVGTERRDGEFQAEVASALEDRFKRSGIGVSQTVTRETIVGANASQFDFLIAFLLAMAVMVAVVGGLGLAGTMSLNVLERTREIGVMRSIGASNRMVRAVVIVEGVLVGVLSWVLAVPLSVPIGLILCVVLGMAIFERPMSLTFSPLGVVIWLAIVVSISVVASLLPAQRAAAMSVRETLAYE
jgi:putative ABC transport system permease protein